MDHTFIINPMEEINYLFEYVFNISTSTDTSPTTTQMSEEKQLVEMLECVSLGDSSMDDVYQTEVIKLPQGEKLETLLMQSPRTIKDFSKFKWLQPLSADMQHWLSKTKGRYNNYLNSLLTIMQDKTEQNRFQFEEVYPHTRNLAANRNFKQGEVLLEIKEEWIFNNRTIPKTYLSRYLEAIMTLVMQAKNVFKTSGLVSEEGFINHIRKVQNQTLSLYIFEKKFIEEIINCPFTSTKKEAYEWLYFKLLPNSFDYHPLREWENIKLYHKDLAHQLQKMEYEFIEEYKLIKQLVDGQFVRDEFCFSSFLKLQNAYGFSIYEKYQRFFTPKNYVWTKLCQKTRAFQYNCTQQESQYDYQLGLQLSIGSKKGLIPFLDLMHHSSTSYNISWHYDQKTNKVVVKAETDIKKGDLLYIKYRNITINTCYIDYGFVDAKQIGWVDLNLAINFDMIQWIASELFQKKVKRRFIAFIENYCLYHDLMAEVRIIDYTAHTYTDHLVKKESVLEDVVEAYTELTLLLLNKHDPQIQKRSYFQKEETMKHKLKRMIVRLIVTSLHNNITQRRAKIDKINRDIYKQKQNWKSSQGLGQRCLKGEQMQDVSNCQEQSTAKEHSTNFNTLYHFTCVRTILATEIKILLKILRLFQRNELK